MASSRLPIVVVLGATGAGKSKLAIEIAKVFRGEIVSADSMQIYKGLDIITNKVTEDEQMGCPHYLMSYLEADHKNYNIVDFRDAALPIISDIFSRRSLPVIVGGTNYYIESLLWDFLIDKRNPQSLKLMGADSQRCLRHQQPFNSRGAACGAARPPLQCCNSPLVNAPPRAGETGSLINAESRLGVENVTVTCQGLTPDPGTDSTDFQPLTHPARASSSSSSGEPGGGAQPCTLHADAPDTGGGTGEMPDQLLSLSPAELYAELQRVDPEVALLHHPNNKRKIVRALQVFHQTGRTMSSLLKEQHRGQENMKSGPLRFPNPCILWIRCDQSVLDQRLDSRVDDMIERGLIAELDSFYNKVQQIESQQHSSPADDGLDYTHGVLQMIGFKEFGCYLRLTPEERATEEGKKEFVKGLSDLKNATRRYARKQIKWIKNRFCGRPGSNVPPVYAVDSTDLTNWSQTVQEAIDVVTAFVKGEIPDKEPESVTRKSNAVPARNVCQICEGQIFIRQDEWEEHLNSKRHKYNFKLIKRERQKLCDLLEAKTRQMALAQQDGLELADTGHRVGDTCHSNSEMSTKEDTTQTKEITECLFN